MAIVYDASSTGAETTSSPLTWTHTCTGSNRLLVVGISTAHALSPNCTGVTYNGTAATVEVGTTSANYDVMIPANANSDGAGFVIPIPTGGWPFSTAITLAVTTGVGATNSGAPSANAAGVLVFYV